MLLYCIGIALYRYCIVSVLHCIGIALCWYCIVLVLHCIGIGIRLYYISSNSNTYLVVPVYQTLIGYVCICYN